MTREIPLTRGKVALVDDNDYERLSRWRWYITDRGYAARTVDRPGRCPKKVFMHQAVWGDVPAGMEVDHRNRNRLDNRLENLRLATHAQNQHNTPGVAGKTSRFKGVRWRKRQPGTGRSKWIAELYVNERAVFRYACDDEEEAARAYDAAAREHFGEFAYLNFPEEQ